jgi:hypothetical protein
LVLENFFGEMGPTSTSLADALYFGVVEYTIGSDIVLRAFFRTALQIR